jgi:hypothetical protein
VIPDRADFPGDFDSSHSRMFDAITLGHNFPTVVLCEYFGTQTK